LGLNRRDQVGPIPVALEACASGSRIGGQNAIKGGPRRRKNEAVARQSPAASISKGFVSITSQGRSLAGAPARKAAADCGQRRTFRAYFGDHFGDHWSGRVDNSIKINSLRVYRGGEGGIRTPDRLAPMPHFECGAFDHSATSPGAMTGRFGPRSGRVLGEEGWADKARSGEIRARTGRAGIRKMGWDRQTRQKTDGPVPLL
jgi:hypothetical protein